MGPRGAALWLAALVLLATGCGLTDPDDLSGPESALAVPPSFPPVPFPAHNPYSADKARLGRKLFFDPRLSADGAVSCASCHLPGLAFSDGVAVSRGVHGRTGTRNSPDLVNVAWETTLFRDGGVFTLEAQVIAPLESFVEMDRDVHEVVRWLATDPAYAAEFQRVYGGPPTVQSFTGAIATYERTIRSGGSPYDDFLAGNTTALSAAEQNGLRLFTESGCATCHSGPLLSNGGFENNGLAIANADSGRARITLSPEDYGKFKVPSLRNVALTAPYMRDGRMATLREVLEHYRAGGDGAGADGSFTPLRNQSPLIRPLPLTDADLADLEDFLHTLTDREILEGPQNP